MFTDKSIQVFNKYKLSDREQEITAKMMYGKYTSEIAKELFVTENTVKFHLTSVYKKFNIKTGRQLMAYLVQTGCYEGFIFPGDGKGKTL